MPHPFNIVSFLQSKHQQGGHAVFWSQSSTNAVNFILWKILWNVQLLLLLFIWKM